MALANEIGLESQAQIIIEDAQKTSSIEGEKLDALAIRSSVAKRLGISELGLPANQKKIDGLVEMLLDSTQNFNKPLSSNRLKSWQAGLFPTGFSGIYKIVVGDWRSSKEPMRVVSGSMGSEKVHFQAPPAENVEKEMNRFIKWFNTSSSLDGLVRAAIAHLWFITIHPFDDGNGRLARAISDLALAQDDLLQKKCYSMSSQICSDRKKYFEILEKSQKGTLDVTEWVFWFLETFIRAIEKSEIIIAKSIAIGNFWKKHAQHDLSQRQKKFYKKCWKVNQLVLPRE